MARDHSYKARLHLSVSRLTTLGWPAFEARENKSPATRRGFKDAQVDSDQVLRWKSNAMAAVATGEKGEIVVIDLDVDSQKGLNGLEWLQKMQSRHGALPAHAIATTPRGGEHHYFRYPADRIVRSTAGKIGPGVDVRATGGYVIVPDSESNNGAYRWRIAPWDVSLPELPFWLLELVADAHPGVLTDDTLPATDADREEVEREIQEILKPLRAAKVGGRNHALNTAAYLLGKMVGAGVVDEAVAESQLFNAAAEIGLNGAESRSTISSGLTAGRKHPWRPSAGHRDLQRLNRDYFFCIDGKTAFVFREHRDPITGNRALSRYYPAAFRELYGNKSALRVLPDGNVKPARLGEAWLSWPGRREYLHVTFAPGRNLPANVFNQWQGFAVDGAEGSCDQFLTYMRDILCGGNENLFRYLEGWCARAVQRPGAQGEVAVVLRGTKGTGKSFFAKHLGELFGEHYVEMTSSRHLTGNFNAHLETAVVVFADEAFWAGDKQGEGTLKALVTSDAMLVERKGIDARMTANFIHLIVASNADWAVPASLDERRFFVLNTSSDRRNDHEYFRRLEDAWQSGEREAFLHHLQTLDISDFNVRKVPQTEALLEQKMMSLGVIDRWFFSALQNGYFEAEPWQEWLPSRTLHESLVSWCKLVNARVPTAEAMGMSLAKLVPLLPGNKSPRAQRMLHGKRAWGYELGNIESCRSHFELIIGAKIEWSTDGDVGSPPGLNPDKY